MQNLEDERVICNRPILLPATEISQRCGHRGISKPFRHASRIIEVAGLSQGHVNRGGFVENFGGIGVQVQEQGVAAGDLAGPRRWDVSLTVAMEHKPHQEA